MGRGGRRSPNEYTYIIAEVFFDPERRKNRVHPIAGESYPTNMLIECSKDIRALPIGTKVRLLVAETEKKDSRKFLYSSYKWAYDVIS